MQKIPGIGDIPILGLLFKSTAYQKNQTELVVMITPTIVRRGSTGVSSGLPALVEPYLTRAGEDAAAADALRGIAALSGERARAEEQPAAGTGPRAAAGSRTGCAADSGNGNVA